MDLIVHSPQSKLTQKHSITFDAIGTQWSIDSNVQLSVHVRRAIERCIDQFDYAYSRFRSDSLVAKLNALPTTIVFPDSADVLMQFYHELYDVTNGKVTPLIGAQLVDAGYDEQYSFTPSIVRSLPTWDEAMLWRGSIVQTYQPIVLDVGAAGKGLLVDQIATILDESDYDSYVIDASGDIRHSGRGVERIGLENPDDPSRVLGIAEVENRSLCASASNRRVWGERMHHIFDPTTKQPTNAVRATWVVADDTMTADGIATALFFVDAEKLSQWDFMYVRLLADGTVERSENFIGELYL
ncbi:FAD:protein FMN transferase [bacterium]|nr:MAG: FAD:protein FMN transferase [bacterium]